MKNNRFKLFNVLRSKDIDEGIDLANVYENWYEEICNSFIKFGSKTYNIFVEDGNLLYEVLQLVKQRRQVP